MRMKSRGAASIFYKNRSMEVSFKYDILLRLKFNNKTYKSQDILSQLQNIFQVLKACYLEQFKGKHIFS